MCCGLFVWSYWMLTLVVSGLYSSLALSLIGLEWKCMGHVSKCIEKDIISDAIKTGAVVSSFATMLQSLNLLIVLMNNRKRYQGYCIGAALHNCIIMLWYAVSVDTLTKKKDNVDDFTKWTKHTVKDLFHSSYYLACILSGMHMFWVLVIANLIKSKRSVSMNEV